MNIRKIISSSVYLGAGCALLYGCMSLSDANPSIFYASQLEADAALEDFAKAQPQCQLWSNWQKLCTRTQSGEKVECKIDPEYKVKPSIPFCIADNLGPKFWRYQTVYDDYLRVDENFPQSVQDVLEVRSANRFCTKFSREQVEFSNLSARKCSADKKERPFNGRSLTLARSDMCWVWSDTKTKKPICAEKDHYPELPRCNDIARKHDIGLRGQLYCSHLYDLYGREPTPDGCWGMGSTTRFATYITPGLKHYPETTIDGMALRGIASSYPEFEFRFSAPYCAYWKNVRGN